MSYTSSNSRQLTLFDQLIGGIDTAIRTIFTPQQRVSERETPGRNFPEANLSEQEKKHVAGLMRVNHAGEVCAQALYQGQALTAKLEDVRAQMHHAALEEVEHLAWCESRLAELNSHPSYLNGVWYLSSLFIGAMAGLAGDQWSLGFVAETEKQVTAHLETHLQNLPKADQKSQAILSQMQTDEMHHAESARAAGAADLPVFIQILMKMTAKAMTRSSYHF